MQQDISIDLLLLPQTIAHISVNLLCNRICILDAFLAFAHIFVISYRSHNTNIISTFPIVVNIFRNLLRINNLFLGFGFQKNKLLRIKELPLEQFFYEINDKVY